MGIMGGLGIMGVVGGLGGFCLWGGGFGGFWFGVRGVGDRGLLGGGAAFGLEGEDALAVGVDVCEEEDGESAQFLVGGYSAGLHVGYYGHE